MGAGGVGVQSGILRSAGAGPESTGPQLHCSLESCR